MRSDYSVTTPRIASYLTPDLTRFVIHTGFMRLPSTERFSSRVENYVKYRPSYPSAVIELLKSACGLTASSQVADIGSGTGILTSLLLETGATVYAVEPNAEMRQAAESLLEGQPGFRSIVGTAEATTLPDSSIDLITAGQAFHWFDIPRSKAEFSRILRPDGWVALIWNERSSESTPFLDGYEKILQTYSPEYSEVGHKRADAENRRQLFRDGDEKVFLTHNSQSFDLEGLVGRVLSSSYAPEAGHPNHAPMISALEDLFAKTSVDGRVDFLYDTQVLYGHM